MLHYYDDEDEDKDKDEDKVEDKDKESLIASSPIPIYENKYLEKFKAFKNEYTFNELELEEEKRVYDRLKTTYERDRKNNINRLWNQLEEIKALCEKVGNGVDTPENKKLLLDFNGFEHDEDDYEEVIQSIHFDELYKDVVNKRELLEQELNDVKEKFVSEEELLLEARNTAINTKLNGYINNYVLEHTPLGNIYMRYNNDKKSFEYFSNNTIPYRYLETVGRKYVMTYWCKPLFVDAEEELKNAELRFDEEKKKREEEEKRKKEEIAKNPRHVLARMKDYNNETKSKATATMNQPMKNRTPNNILPSQIKANLVNVNHPSEKQLLKEHSNRYTWEGRLTNFNPLQKVDKKYQNLTLSYADFKIMQQKNKS